MYPAPDRPPPVSPWENEAYQIDAPAADCPFRMNGVLARVHWRDRVTLRFLRISCRRRLANSLHTERHMRAMIRDAVVLGCARCSACWRRAPRPRSPIDQVVALAKAGVTDTVILALIDRDRTVFAIEPEQIVSLQRDGLSENDHPRDAEERARRRRAGGARRRRVQLGVDRVRARDRAADGDRRPRTRSAEHAARRRLLLGSAGRRRSRRRRTARPTFRYRDAARRFGSAPRPQRAARALLRADQHAARRRNAAPVCHRMSGRHAADAAGRLRLRIDFQGDLHEIPHRRARRGARAGAGSSLVSTPLAAQSKTAPNRLPRRRSTRSTPG